MPRMQKNCAWPSSTARGWSTSISKPPGASSASRNIYKGVVTRVEPSLEACFVDYGEERHGFLPFKEVSRIYFRDGVDVRNARIQDALKEGQELIVQIEKEERGNKGAALTTFISLAGRYLVLMPNNPRGGGVSRRIEGEDRQELRETMDQLDLPAGMAIIARTAGIGRTVEELQWDLNYLMQLWHAIEGAGAAVEWVTDSEGKKTTRTSTARTAEKNEAANPPPFLIYRGIEPGHPRDPRLLPSRIGEILVDTDDIYEQARQFMAHVMPDMCSASSATRTTCRCSRASRSSTRSKPRTRARCRCRRAARS